MTETKKTKNWLIRHAEAEAEKDIMPFSDRIGNGVATVFILLVLSYFLAHQMWSTGFFTSKFGTLEAFLFYGVLLYQIFPTSLKALFGRKNLARLPDIFGSVLGTIALAWLLVIFPFNFTYFADVLPNFLRFLLQWISNDIARILMALGIIATPIMTIYNAMLYVFVSRELSKQT